MPRDSFILYLEQKQVFEMLTDEEAGQLIKAIFEYEDTGQIINLERSLQIAFVPIKNVLDRNKEKYEKVVERNKKNIEKRWNEKNTKNTTGKNGIQKNTKNTDNDNEHDNEHDNDNITTTVVKKDDSCVDGLSKIIDFYNNNIGLITPHGLEVLSDYAKEMDADLIIFAMQISVEANIRTMQYIKAILNNWQKAGIKTLIEAKKENKSKKSISAKEEFLNEQE